MPVLPEYDYEGDPWENIPLPVAKQHLNTWLYNKAYNHALKHHQMRPGAPESDLRHYLGKELEFTANALECTLPQHVADVHPDFLTLSDSVIEAYEDVFGEDVYA